MEKQLPVEAPLIAWVALVLELVALLVSELLIVLVLVPELDPVLLAVFDPRSETAISESTASTSVSIAEPEVPPEVPEANLQ